jgi:hypothetical protein
MSPIEIHTLVEAGGESLARQKIKKLAIPQRMGFFRDASPWIPKSPKSLAFYRKYFAQEIGAQLGFSGGRAVIQSRAIKRLF